MSMLNQNDLIERWKDEDFYVVKTRENRIESLLIEVNGGPGSGNHNPGQGRGVGKPTGGSASLSLSIKNPKKVKEKIIQALKKEGVDVDKYSSINRAIYHSTTPDKREKDVVKEIVEKYGYDENDYDSILETEEYREFTIAREKKAQQRKNALLSKFGVPVFDDEAIYMSEDSYRELLDDIETGKFTNPFEKEGRGSIVSSRDTTRYYTPLVHYSLYSVDGFNLDTGTANVKNYFNNQEIDKENFVRDEDYEKFINTKVVKVDENVIKKAMEQAVSSKTNSAVSGVFPKITRAEERALQEYNLVSAVNSTLRAGEKTEASTLIESAINKSCSESKEVYRGVRGDFAEKIKTMKKDDTITDKGFMSTSYSIGTGDETEGASKFGNTILKIKTKSGFGQGIDMHPYVRDNRFESEDEFLLNSGTTLKFTGESTEERWTDKNYEEKEKVKVYNFEVV